MPLSTRPRPPRTTDGKAGNPVNAAMPTVANNSTTGGATTTYTLTTLASDHDLRHSADDDVGAELPPAKRRKVAIRERQTTLEHFIVSGAGAAPPQPPTRLSRPEPHGPLLETINGARNLLDINEDEISQADTRSRASSKAPQAQQHQNAATAPPTKQEDKRTLRSHDDGPKLKSELAIYFSNYDEIIFEPPKEPEFLTVNSMIHITDESAKQKRGPCDIGQESKGCESRSG